MKYFLLLLPLFLICVEALSQTDTEVSTDLNQDLLTAGERSRVNALRNEFGFTTNLPEDVRLTQIGTSNEANLQLRQDLASDKASLGVTQSQFGGVTGNKVNFNFDGSGTDITVIQRGDENLYNSNLSGTAQSIGIVQDGFNNEIQQNAQLQSGARIELIQLGDDNFLDADKVGRSIQVTQRGGANATLREIVD